MTDTAPSTHRQPSRKGKKAWRKNVDIGQVTDGLDTVRAEVRDGGVVAERAADQLFATDLTGDAELARKQRSGKVLKADEILAQRSAVPGLEGRKKRKAGDESETAVVGTSGKKSKNGKYVSHASLQRLRGVANNQATTGGDAHMTETPPDHDPWAITPAPVQPAHLDFLEPVATKKEPKTLRHPPIPAATAPSHHPLPNVRKPAAGKSYNPLLADWTALLNREGAKAVEAETARLAAEAAEADRDARALAEAERVEAREAEEGMESEWGGFSSDDDDGAAGKEVFTAKAKGRKTPAQRKKAEARKLREAREGWEKRVRARETEEKRIEAMVREAATKDRAARKGNPSQTLARPTWSSDDDDDGNDDDDDIADSQPRRFGRHPLPPAPLELVLPDELQESLRRLKPEGDALNERYRNLLLQGKLEVRRRRGKETWKMPRRERTEKWGYKDFKLM
ncbi:hypothetical protein B0A50_08636 [Salinomyces thailandicus]|uniref:Ribosome biogenesis protein NOP53 n=1 Tax=Salinomyces thailandicus TaxID=706561 RepID=A0A4V5N4K3_9PEZI|nr:hypothetical protein B0A50_08636 [Salinomyces thailandica]